MITIVLILGLAAVIGVALYALQQILLRLEALHHALERIATAVETLEEDANELLERPAPDPSVDPRRV